MKIVVTGSLGNISKLLTKELVQNGNQVTVISTRPYKQKAIVKHWVPPQPLEQLKMQSF